MLSEHVFSCQKFWVKIVMFPPLNPPRHLFLDISVGQPSSYFILREWEGGVGDFAHDWGNSWQNKKWGQNSAQNEICSCSLPPAHKTAVRVLRSDEAINSGACFILHTIPWSVPPFQTSGCVFKNLWAITQSSEWEKGGKHWFTAQSLVNAWPKLELASEVSGCSVYSVLNNWIERLQGQSKQRIQ